MLEKNDTRLRDVPDQTHDHDHVTDRRHISPKLVGAAIVAVALVIFVLANTANAEINFVFDTLTAPIWLVLTVVIVVSFFSGLLVGSARRRH